MKVFLLELNEFSLPLLEEATCLWKLPHLAHLLRLQRAKTHTEDAYESDFLEPWVQWVSAHTGLSSKEHRIKHLGDVPKQGTDQLWERLSDQGVTSGIWSPMNARRGRAEKCLFFLPDPWTASENAYPSDLNSFLDPLRYTSTNYLERSPRILMQKMRGLWQVVRKRKLTRFCLGQLPLLLWNALRFRGAHFVFIAFAEALSTELFLRYRAQYNPTFSLLFLNTLAHLQHHHWHKPEVKGNTKLKAGLQQIDKMIGRILSSLEKNERLYVANALSQMNTHSEKPWVLYRQLNPSAFLRAVAIPCEKVEPHMTHDAHLYFSSAEGCRYAFEQLTSARICEKPLFHVESYPQDPRKLFYKLIFTDPAPLGAMFTMGGRSYRFYDLFQEVVTRTGKHIQTADLLSTEALPPQLKNHEIFSLILQGFAQLPQTPLQKRPEQRLAPDRS